MIRASITRILASVLAFTLFFAYTPPLLADSLTGNYVNDTIEVVQELTRAVELPADAPPEVKKEIQAQARRKINDYIARYRRNNKYNGLRSFTTMQTALNSLAGYYTSYGTRPLPDKLKQRILQEFKQVEFALKKGY
ncbi:MAG: photosystem II protein Psb27 [Geminocystis sp.]|nr:photosystem II protein Psb27 [Geminocystis sp.]HIK36726.1 photosystem II protein Psb27 [Geminocystis sp. M7585_C2015_104]MCS7146806.1 photosystem II protein Psb27 [Geminocystis sp.]MCX8077044.1 photosystem II protein Psb27 [Geminocystis sp.]MDW8115632.1 photosystem II protein Psb27 [Geminocystis sp.]